MDTFQWFSDLLLQPRNRAGGSIEAIARGGSQNTKHFKKSSQKSSKECKNLFVIFHRGSKGSETEPDKEICLFTNPPNQSAPRIVKTDATISSSLEAGPFAKEPTNQRRIPNRADIQNHLITKTNPTTYCHTPQIKTKSLLLTTPWPIISPSSHQPNPNLETQLPIKLTLLVLTPKHHHSCSHMEKYSCQLRLT